MFLVKLFWINRVSALNDEGKPLQEVFNNLRVDEYIKLAYRIGQISILSLIITLITKMWSLAFLVI